MKCEAGEEVGVTEGGHREMGKSLELSPETSPPSSPPQSVCVTLGTSLALYRPQLSHGSDDLTQCEEGHCVLNS